MQASEVITRIIFPQDTVFDFVGEGLTGSKGHLDLKTGAGLDFSEWGQLILKLLEDGGLLLNGDGFLGIDKCHIANAIAGLGLVAKDCKLNVDVTPIIGCGLQVGDDGTVSVNTSQLAGAGLAADACDLSIDTGWLATAVQSQITNDSQIDPAQTATVSYLVDTTFRYTPSGYGYNNGIEIVKTTNTLTIYKNAAGLVVNVVPGSPTTTTQDFNFGLVQNASHREETPSSPNFYNK